MKIISWNVNGLRSAHKKGFLAWAEKEKADIICLQEVKASLETVTAEDFSHPKGYTPYWSFGKKPGYSGLGVYTRLKPKDVKIGIGKVDIDSEGRWLELSFGEVVLVNSYFPNSQRDHARLDYKLNFCDQAWKRLQKLRQTYETVVICGDLNIAHREIDLKNAKTNKKNAGFLPEERAWMDMVIDQKKWVDTFREFEPGPGHYTWWSARPGVREKNVGWRIDYFLVNPEAREKVKKSEILSGVMGSDHCPIKLELDP